MSVRLQPGGSLRPRRVNERNVGYLFILPFFVFLFLFVLLPIVFNIAMSFTNYNLMTMKAVGFQNYLFIFADKTFKRAFLNTLIFTVAVLALNLTLGLALSLGVNRKLRAMKLIRTCLFAPYVTSMVSVSMIWLWMYQPMGAFNAILGWLNLPSLKWIYSPDTAMLCIIVMSVWKTVGYYMLIFLAGLQGIPESLVEAALIDGASPWQTTRHIRLPLLRPVIFFITVTGTIQNFNAFEQIKLMTGGGPMHATTTLAHQIYTRAFEHYQFGISAAQSVILMLVVFVFILLNYRYGNQGNDLEVG
ncbi:MAG: sugar ABC transporter permease [Candidatus Limiplasma sp.]|nr:sugar ABC transporter permease [Candidatus Limiplasma sp.]